MKCWVTYMRVLNYLTNRIMNNQTPQYATKADKRRAAKQRKRERERVLLENDTIADYLTDPDYEGD